MYSVGTTRNKVYTDTDIPLTRIVSCIFVYFTKRFFPNTINENNLRVEFGHQGFFFIQSPSQAPKIRIQSKDLCKSLIAI